MLEDIWKPNPRVAIYNRLPPIINPPVAGPSGLTYSPGTGLPSQYNNTFFLCYFRGGAAGGSGIYAIRNMPRGATFEAKTEPFATNILPTDVEFGYDGGLYYSDWTGGWELPGKGRIYHIFDPQTAQAPVVAETAKLIAEGFGQRPANELASLLAHPDMRVRLEAQFALAAKGAESVSTFAPVAESNPNQLARLHAIWGLGQIARKTPDALKSVLPLLGDKDDEVRAQTAKVLGDAKYAGAYDGLLKALTDSNARVRFFAAMGLGKLGRAQAVPAILNLLRENNDADPYLRHAGVMALVWIKDMPAIESAAKDSSKAVRIASLLAMRRLALPQVATFLSDADDEVVLEAARAIYDLPIEPALPKLAALVAQPKWSENKPLNEMVLVRALAANYRLGTPEAAKALATYAAGRAGNENYRVAALNMLGDWQAPKGRDYLTGLWRPLAPRPPAGARDAVQPLFAQLLRSTSGAVQIAAAQLTPKLGVEDPAVMFELATGKKFDPKVRAAALDALDAGKGDRGRLAEAVASALKDSDEGVRGAAIRLQAKLPGGVAKLRPIFEQGTPRERQAVIGAVANVKNDPAADAIVSAAMDQLLAGTLPPEMQLDALEAAAARKDHNPRIAQKLAAFEAGRKSESEDPLSHFREAMAGGDAERGQRIFQLRADVSCLKCHSVKAQGGTAGPDLAGIGTRGTREYILESILYPNKKIATGFETIALKTKSGVVTGVLKAEDANAIQLDVPDKGVVTVRKSDVQARRGGMSAMPEGFGAILSKRDLRDVVEYLANLK
jgi:quinoprotein glucose dehydrogenase